MRKHGRRVGLLPAREIRDALAGGASDAELAKRYGCSLSTISRIAHGVVQPDAGGPVRTERPRANPVVARTVKLPAELADRVDRARGDEPYSRWMCEAAEERLVRAKRT